MADRTPNPNTICLVMRKASQQNFIADLHSRGMHTIMDKMTAITKETSSQRLELARKMILKTSPSVLTGPQTEDEILAMRRE